MGKLINIILSSCLLISSLPGSTLRTHVELLSMSTSVLKDLPGTLDIKRLSPSILYFSASLTMSTSVLKALPGYQKTLTYYSLLILYCFTKLFLFQVACICFGSDIYNQDEFHAQLS